MIIFVMSYPRHRKNRPKTHREFTGDSASTCRFMFRSPAAAACPRSKHPLTRRNVAGNPWCFPSKSVFFDICFCATYMEPILGSIQASCWKFGFPSSIQDIQAPLSRQGNPIFSLMIHIYPPHISEYVQRCLGKISAYQAYPAYIK